MSTTGGESTETRWRDRDGRLVTVVQHGPWTHYRYDDAPDGYDYFLDRQTFLSAFRPVVRVPFEG